MRPDQHGGKAHEAHDLADARLALGVEPGAEHEIRITVMGRGGAVMTDKSAHQFCTGKLGSQRLAHDVVHLASLGSEANETLDETDVAQRIAGALASSLCMSSTRCWSRSVLLTTQTLAMAKNRIRTTSSSPAASS